MYQSLKHQVLGLESDLGHGCFSYFCISVVRYGEEALRCADPLRGDPYQVPEFLIVSDKFVLNSNT
jgi:hypothetical protein